MLYTDFIEVLVIDLLQHFTEILPPTIARKKRESDRKVPIRKRTAPVDLRLSRSRLSVGIDPHELLEAQMVAKNPAMKRAASPAPPLPPLPTSDPEPPTQAVPRPPPVQNTAATMPQIPPPPPVIPPPPPLNQPVVTPLNIPPPPPLNIPPPPPLVAPRAVAPAPPPPVIPVESPPPPRPNFREPSPEVDSAPPMPRFKSPPPESEDERFVPPTSNEAAASPITVAPPTPRLDGMSPASNAPSQMSPLSDPASATMSPSDERPGASLTRSGSNEASRLRGPRTGLSRGPRPVSQSVASISANFNRMSGPNSPATGRAPSPGGASLHRANKSSLSGIRSGSPVNPHDYEPKRRGGRAQAGAFSRKDNNE